MRVLHIAGAFAQHPLYSQLVRHLRELLEYQAVFAPVRSADEAARQPANEPALIEYEFHHILKPLHRALFRTKIRRIHSTISRLVDSSDFDVVHAHTLYSDGAVALRIKQQLGRPYIVAVRNTDLNIFMRWRPDLHEIGCRVLREAEQVICLSPAYRNELLSKLGPGLRSTVEGKCVVVPNGLDEYWYESATRKNSLQRPLRLLYVGDSSRNKNISGTVRAAVLLATGLPLELTLVGSGRNERRVRHWLEKYPFVQHLGRVEDRAELRNIYREHDIFVMPSFKETFGVAYLEALSQGLPVVHSRGQGIDGFFSSGTVSEAVDPSSPSGIATGIKALASRLDGVQPMAIHEAGQFAWSRIAQSYVGIYAAATLHGPAADNSVCANTMEGNL